MSRVLVVGASGVFGSVICKRLANVAGVQLVCGSRALVQARKVAQAYRADALALDWRDPGVPEILRKGDIKIVVNTAGPFVSYAAALRCIEAGVHYVDLADSRPYTEGFGAALHDAAKQKGVVAIAAASSVCGISSCVVDNYAREFSSLTAVDFFISSGARTGLGVATLESILKYSGKDISVLQDGAWAQRPAYGDARLLAVPGLPARRLVSRCDVPDLSLFPKRYPTLRTVAFRAGVELKALQAAVQAMSVLRRMGLAPDWSRQAKALHDLAALQRFGTYAGAMRIRMEGKDAEGRLKTVDWAVLGDSGDALNVPSTPAVVLATKLARGERELLPAGAYPCMGVFTLSDVVASLRGFDVSVYRDGLCGQPLTRSVYEHGIGVEAFARMPAAVRTFHGLGGCVRGKMRVTHGRGVLGLLARMGGLPLPAEAASVEVTTGGEHARVWHRTFEGRPLVSVVSARNGVLVESFHGGLVQFGFQMKPLDEGRGGFLHVTKAMWLIWGLLRVPRWAMITADGQTIPTRDGTGWLVNVSVRMPWGAELIRYEGTLYEAPKR